MRRKAYIDSVNQALGGAKGKRSKIRCKSTGRYYTNRYLNSKGAANRMSVLEAAVSSHIRAEGRGKKGLPVQRYYTADVRPPDRAPRGYGYVGSWLAEVTEVRTSGTVTYECKGAINLDPRIDLDYLEEHIRAAFISGACVASAVVEKTSGAVMREIGDDYGRRQGAISVTVDRDTIETYVQLMKIADYNEDDRFKRHTKRRRMRRMKARGKHRGKKGRR